MDVVLEYDTSKFSTFHEHHFLGQSVPPFHDLSAVSGNLCANAGRVSQTIRPTEDQENDLGWYADGVKRTLTDDQIAMFRHSEIQRLRRQRMPEAEATDDDSELRIKKRKKEPAEEQNHTNSLKIGATATQKEDELRYAAEQDSGNGTVGS